MIGSDQEMMHKPAYQLRDNINPVKISGDSGSSGRYLLTHPDTNVQFELGEEELYLLNFLDGRRDTSELLAAFNEKFSLSLNEETFGKFLTQLESYGLFVAIEDDEQDIEDEPVAEKPSSSEEGETDDDQEKKSGKSGQIHLFDPYPLFNFIVKTIAPFRFLGWLLIPGTVVALFIMFNNYEAYLVDLETLDLRVGATSHLVKIIIVLFTANLLTKISQGLVCTHFGGVINSFGLKLLLFLIPRFFVDKGPIKKLGRSGKLWTFGMSIIVRMTLFMFGMILWNMNRGSGTLISSYALFFGMIGLASSIFIANPLWKADGYNWLSTYLNMPNLRTNAFLIMQLILKGRPLPPTLPTSERNGLIVFGIASFVYTFMFIGGIVYALFIGLEQSYEGLGVFLFLGLLGVVFYYFHSKLKTKKEKLAKKGKSTGKVKQLQKYGAAKFSKKVKGIAPAGTKRVQWGRALFLGILGGLCFFPYQYEVGGKVQILPARQLEVHVGTTSEVIKVNVNEGDYVTMGQVLGRLSDLDITRQITFTDLEIQSKQAELDLLNERAKEEEVAVAERQKVLAETSLEFSEKDLERLAPLVEGGLISGKQFETSVSQVAMDKASVRIAEANIAFIKSAPRESEIRLVKIALKQLEKQLQFLNDELEKTYIRSPLNGKVITKDLDEHLGRYLPEGGLFTVIQESDTVEVEIMIPESEIGLVKEKAVVSFKVEAYPNKIFQGKIVMIATSAEEDSENSFEKIIRARSRVSNSHGRLKSMMTGYGKIKCEEMWTITAFSRKIMSFVLIEMWSWIP
jgi:multidrug resistance efflux pump